MSSSIEEHDAVVYHIPAASVAEAPALNPRMQHAVTAIGERLPAVSALTNRDRHYRALERYDFERMPIFAYSFDVLRTMQVHEGRDAALETALMLPFAWELALYSALPDALPSIGEAVMGETEAQASCDPLQLAMILHADERTARRTLTRTFTHLQKLRTVARVLDQFIHRPAGLTVR